MQEMQMQETDAKTEQRAYARFYKKAVQDEDASTAAGRAVCVVKDYVEIVTPGDRTNVVDRPARPDDKARFARQWQAYQVEGDQEAASGTLLSAWGALSSERVEWFRFYKVTTVEQLAGLTDGNLSNFDAQARKDRESAQAFLEAAAARAPITQMRAELKERDDRIAALELLLRGPKPEAKALVTDIHAPTEAPRKRGRPPKPKEAAP